MFDNINEFLTVKDLTVSYISNDRKVHAVNHVYFSLEKGKTLAMVGETGAGKTTIAKTIMRILPDRNARIEGGQVILDGEDLLSVSEKRMRNIRGKGISMVFQDPMTALNPAMSVGFQIAEVVREHGVSNAIEAKARAEEMLATVGIPPERFNEYPHKFSGGMKQRVIIAIALACNPDLLLADEPTTALDVTIQAQIMALIRELKTKYHTSLILITHDLGIVANMADTVAVVYAGEIIEYGIREEIFLHPAHPYTIGLFGAIPDLNKHTRRLTNIPGLPPDPADLPKGCCFCARCKYAVEECEAVKTPVMEINPNHLCSCRYWNQIKKERE
jgi:peptide/nickel transport system ATP-binding protein